MGDKTCVFPYPQKLVKFLRYAGIWADDGGFVPATIDIAYQFADGFKRVAGIKVKTDLCHVIARRGLVLPRCPPDEEFTEQGQGTPGGAFVFSGIPSGSCDVEVRPFV